MNTLNFQSVGQRAVPARFTAEQTKSIRVARNAIGLLAAVVVMLVVCAGCGRKPAADSTSKAPAPVETVSVRPVFDLWTAGDATGATAAFLKFDFRQGPLFATGEPLRLSEAELMAVPAGERQAKIEQVMRQTGEIKKLAAHVAKLGQDAAAKNDAATARRCFEQLRQFGEALEQANPPKITQLTAQAIRKQAEQALAKLPQ